MKNVGIKILITLGYAWLLAGIALDGYVFWEYFFGDSVQLSDPIRHWPHLMEIQLLLCIPMLVGIMIGATVFLAIVMVGILTVVYLLGLFWAVFGYPFTGKCHVPKAMDVFGIHY